MSTSKFKTLQNTVAEKCRKQVLPFERSGSKKTLRDFCLEFCAKNFDEIFIAKHKDGMLSVKKDIYLPPFIFEEVERMSRKLGCYVRPHLLKMCLGFRANLHWQNIDIHYLNKSDMLLSLDDLKNIAKDEIPVTKLSFCPTEEITEKWLLYISKFAYTLEHLAIGPDYSNLGVRDYYDSKVASKLRNSKIKFPKLKYLKLNFITMSLSALDMIDIDSFKDSLRVLQICSYVSYHDKINKKYNANFDTNVLISMIKNCKRVISLSLSLSYVNKEEEKQLFQAVGSLKELKVLDLFGFKYYFGREKYNLDFIASLPNLQYLEASCSHFFWTDWNNLDKIHLKYFGSYGAFEENDFKIRADVVSRGEDLESLLNAIKYIVRDQDRIEIYAVKKVAQMLSTSFSHSFTKHERNRLEQILTTNIFRNPYCSHSMPQDMMNLIKNPAWYPFWSGDFLAMITRHHMNI